MRKFLIFLSIILYAKCKDVFEDKQIPKCFGFFADETDVCSSNGKCIGQDKCSCALCYIGANCELRDPISCFDCPSMMEFPEKFKKCMNDNIRFLKELVLPEDLRIECSDQDKCLCTHYSNGVNCDFIGYSGCPSMTEFPEKFKKCLNEYINRIEKYMMRVFKNPLPTLFF